MSTIRNISLPRHNKSSKLIFPLSPKYNKNISLLSQRDIIDKITNSNTNNNTNDNINNTNTKHKSC